MSVVLSVLYLAVLLYVVLLLVRLVFNWVQQFARDWKPQGVTLVVAELTFTVTDPPLRAVRRIIPPLRIGAVALDLGFILVFIACSLLLGIIQPHTL
ncbi:YggT family protein [Pseudactinotalea sp. Z1732]|uniref:YggT family protein n=1 Tax=Micrococcales TaxID=85006 RepID=UPI003C7CE25C